MEEHATPTRVVLPREIFFSLTDSRGVITGANETFSRIARLSRDELLCAPHSVVRNPGMPAGVFRLMWDVIQAGRPFAGYVLNRAKDGANYWVYATVTPLADGGYLSVRTAPCLAEVWVTAATLYDKALAYESDLRVHGMNRRDTAVAGRDYVLRQLGELGFASYEDFMLATLPAEVMERVQRAGTGYTGALDDDVLETIHQLALEIGREAAELLTQLERFSSLGEALQHASGQAEAAAEGLMSASTAARQTSEVVAHVAPAVLSTAQAMENGGRQTLAALADLGAQLALNARLLRGLQIRIAIVRLHADMVAAFVDEATSLQHRDDALVNLPELSRAVYSTVAMLADALAAHAKAMRGAVSTIDTISSGLSEFQSFLFMWRTLLIRHGVSSEVAHHLAPIDRQLSAGSSQIAHLRDLAQRCLAEAQPYDTSGMVDRVRQLAALGEQERVAG